MFRKDGSNRVDCIVTIKPLANQAPHRGDHLRDGLRQLILDNGMDHSVKSRLRKRDASALMKALDKQHPLRLIELQPLLRLRRHVRVVVLHDAFLVQLTVSERRLVSRI